MKTQNSKTIANAPKAEVKKIDAKVLDKLNSITIAEKSKNGVKSIFKKEFSEKGKRSATRNKFYNLIDLFLLFIKREELDKAQTKFNELVELCNERYIAENSFKNVDEYSTSNLEESKKEKLKIFIELAESFK